MLREADVPKMMTRVRHALEHAERSPAGTGGFIDIPPEGDPEMPIATLRKPADIEIEFISGSARPVVGSAVRYTKRVVRRSLRWYLKPMMTQQSRFNHAVLDALETLRMRNEVLELKIDEMRRAQVDVVPEGTAASPDGADPGA